MKGFGIYGYIIGINAKTVTEIIIQGVYIYKECDSKYIRLPSAALLCKGFCESFSFCLKFSVALATEFWIFEMITFFLYYTKNKEINLGIWSSCYQIAAMGIYKKVICLDLESHPLFDHLYYIKLVKMQ